MASHSMALTDHTLCQIPFFINETTCEPVVSHAKYCNFNNIKKKYHVFVTPINPSKENDCLHLLLENNITNEFLIEKEKAS